VYVLWLDDDGWTKLGNVMSVGGVAYVGVGDPSLQRRYKEEWRPKNSGRSSPRRTLGALLAENLDLSPRPRVDRDRVRGARYYVFGDEGELRLTAWVEKHASFACETTAGAPAGTVETQVILRLQPPLNLTKWPNPLKEELGNLRNALERRAGEFVSE
jgi:hypothetical protein